ncbi:ribosomal protein S19 binding protein 1 [Scyliorhinus canicula]|uniref:ribosomal protein S19 binding protein 1 n=1 Tax=Scyliorhinus canicula TaxID=7830 RepID=UPI0018F53526|nr:ribosomal protein S19 binding protein 1 [Scyliorhinus canicula]
MSAALLRKGLDLLSADVRDKGESGKRVTPGLSKGAKKRLERIQRQGKKNKATVKDKVFKSALDEYWKKKAADHTEENLQYMLGSKFLTEDSVTQKVLAYNQGRKAKDRPETEEAKKEEKSVFTESEFRKFEREYFGAP